jgi:heavy metal sensor kinase
MSRHPRPLRLLPISLRLRLTLWYGALVLLVLLGFTAFAYLEVRTALYSSVDDALASRAAQIAAVTTLTSGGVRFQTDGTPSGLGDGAVLVLDRRGRLLEPQRPAGSLPDVAAVRRALTGAPSWTSAPRNLRLYTALVRDDAGRPFVIQVAGSRAGAAATLGRVLAALLLAVPLLVLVSAGGGAFLARRALRPIDRITRTARRIGAGDLHERLGLPPRDDEVGRLASTFDEMLDRLETMFMQQRQFTADASHELRTPLTIVQGEVEVARLRRRAPEAYEATLETIQGQVSQMTGIIEDLLALARADSGHAEIDREIVELDELVRRAAAHSLGLFEAKDLHLSLQLQPDVIVIGDPGKLTQVLLNLLSNAARYTDHGGASVELSSDGGQARLVVSDTGIGIPPEHLQRIFERFYRVDKARSRAAGGSGLGLAIARWVVGAHGGTISAGSEVGCGSVFRVTLPLAPADEHAGHDGVASAPPPGVGYASATPLERATIP